MSAILTKTMANLDSVKPFSYFLCFKDNILVLAEGVVVDETLLLVNETDTATLIIINTITKMINKRVKQSFLRAMMFAGNVDDCDRF